MTTALTRYRVRINVWDIYETFIAAMPEEEAIGCAEQLFYREFNEHFAHHADGIEGEASPVAAGQGDVKDSAASFPEGCSVSAAEPE